MRATVICITLCLLGNPVFAQSRNEAAIDQLINAVVRVINDAGACELVHLWTHRASGRRGHVVRLYPVGEMCDEALETAAQAGRPFGIRFSTLAELRETSLPHARVPRTRRYPMLRVAPDALEHNQLQRPHSLILIDDRLPPPR